MRILRTTRPMRRRRRRDRRRRGTAAVEMALILPLLVTIVLGCIDFGRFAYYYIGVTNAARVGANFASLNPVTTATRPVWEAQLKQTVLDELPEPHFDHTQVSIPLAEVVDDGDFRRARIVVVHPFEPLVSWPMLPGTFPLPRKVEMRVIR